MEERIRAKLAVIDATIVRLEAERRQYASSTDSYFVFRVKVYERMIKIHNDHKHALINRTDDMETLLRVSVYLPGPVITM